MTTPLIFNPNKKRLEELDPISPRTLVLGDIHGSAKALAQALDLASVRPEDTIITLGDIGDRYPETSECVDILLTLPNHINIRGNHDVWIHDWITLGRKDPMWEVQGGRETISSYLKSKKFLDKFHVDFWKDQVDWYLDDNNRLFIHGGWDFRSGDFPESALYTMNSGSISRMCHWDRSLLAEAFKCFSEGLPFDKTSKFKEVYVGHTPIKDFIPKQFFNMFAIDTGCGVSGGRLTIMDIDTKEYWLTESSTNFYDQN